MTIGKTTQILLLASLALGLSTTPTTATEDGSPPHFQEVLRLLRVNLRDVSEEELNATIVDALLKHYHPRVRLAAEASEDVEDSAESLVIGSRHFRDSFGYVRILRVQKGLTEQLSQAIQNLQSTQSLEGLVLDARFSGGTDFKEAARVADLFVPAGHTLLQLEDENVESSPSEWEVDVPLVVLINSQSSGATEVLAASLRENSPTLLIGQATAGQTFAYQRFELSNGQALEIAALPIRVGDGVELKNGVQPDIPVDVSPEDEEAYLLDPYKPPLSSASTTGGQNDIQRRQHLNEAELLRLQQERLEGGNGFIQPRQPSPQPAAPVVRDPALKRGLDLLTGISVVRRSLAR